MLWLTPDETGHHPFATFHQAWRRVLSQEPPRVKQSGRTLEPVRADHRRLVQGRTPKPAQINRQNLGEMARRCNASAPRGSRPEAPFETRELELFYRAAPVGLCLLDEKQTVIKANPTMEALTDITAQRLIGQSLETVCPPLAKALSPVIRQISSTGKPMPSHVVSLPGNGKDRRPRHWLVSSYPLMVDDGRRIGTSHIFQDISEQRRAQELIRHSKTMLQAVFDGIDDPLMMVDRKMVVCMINRAAKTYYGIDDYGRIIGKRCPDLFAGDGPCETCRIPELVASGRSATFERPGLFVEDRLERVAVYPLCQSAGGLEGAIIQISDITETKNLERQLFHSEKLASLGLLASGVAHEINNPNGFITFNLPILRNYVSAVLSYITRGQGLRDEKSWFGMSFESFCADLFQLIDNMEHGAQRISKIVAGMNTLAQPKRGGDSLRKCRLDQVLEQVETLCSGELKRVGQRLILDCPADLPELMLDAGSLEQVLINLLMNAAQAADKSDAWIRLGVERPEADILVIVVQDNGCGMDQAVRQKIFDPFFTTKAPGSGIGLGMAICHNLVVAMGGTIHVESAVGQGSTFRITLPALFHPGTVETDSKGRVPCEDQVPVY
jgi:PAS domain S-box-containing protein